MNVNAFLAILRTALAIPGLREVVLEVLGHGFDLWIEKNKNHPVWCSMLHLIRNAIAMLMSNNQAAALPNATK